MTTSELDTPWYTIHKSIAQPWECDSMGHLTTRFYLARFDEASYHLLYEAFGWTHNDNDSNGWADIRHVIEYKAEVLAGELLEIRGRVTKIGTKSFSAFYEMHSCSNQQLAATLEAVSACFDLKQRRAIAIPDELRQRVQLTP